MAVLPGVRVRNNGVVGITTDNPLSMGATTFSSASLAQLGVVIGNHAIVTLDPMRQFGEPEIVMVTTHTAASTVATVQRGMYGTTPRVHPAGTLWVHAATTDDFVRVVTSTTRPPDPFLGQVIYETDTLLIKSFNGSEWSNVSGTGIADHGTLTGLADDDHPQYQLRTEKGAANGYASLDAGSKIPIGQIPAAVATDTEVTTAVTTHEAAADPHTGYQRESEKDTANGYAGLDGTGVVPDSRIAPTIARISYVDSVVQGLDIKTSVRAATTANITLSGAQTIDGISVIANDRVLVKDQTTGSQNGVYVAAAGAWTRATDADTSSEVTPGMFVFVEQGTANADSGWVLTTDAPITLGTTALVFTQFSGAGQIIAGTGITKVGNTISVTDPVPVHVAAADPHTGYQQESEKGAASGYAGLDAGTKVPTVQLGGAGADSTKFLRGDQTWAVPPGTGGGGGGGETDPLVWMGGF